ncbi:MAG: hypothetical protein R2873_09870 [Caldilineaceae bacterium]
MSAQMASTKHLNSEYLRKLIHDALGQWRRAEADDNLLADLLIFQRAGSIWERSRCAQPRPRRSDRRARCPI